TEEQKTKTFSDTLEDWSEEWILAVDDGLFVQRDFEKGQMARDMTLYVDEDGTAYHIHASEENLTLHISELTDDYLGFTGKYILVQPTGHNEAPSIFKHNGKYYMITSGCTGWAPNAARLLVSDSVMGDWEYIGNPCIGKDKDLTFHSQSTFIIPVKGKKDAFIFMADRWNPQDAIDGRYIWLPIQFNENDQPYLEWMDEWDLSVFN
ncbi:MAG: family 43 glycosylhydrolase, partial [Mariniphaga sp.]|nr:family 43 glycosylhydrolase [Mariniphaga sp.]